MSQHQNKTRIKKEPRKNNRKKIKKVVKINKRRKERKLPNSIQKKLTIHISTSSTQLKITIKKDGGKIFKLKKPSKGLGS